MKKLPLSPPERAQLNATSALSTDTSGHEVLVGLTREESEWCLCYEKAQFDNEPRTTAADDERYMALYDRHESHRLLQLDAVVQMRVERPNKH
jgi:hypothetical protein